MDVPVRQTYTYRVPDGLRGALHVGSLVRVPVRGREVRGVVARMSLFTDAPKQRLKAIENILTPEYVISPDLMALGQWMTEYYLGGGQARRSARSVFFGLNDEKPRTERRLALADGMKWEGIALDSPQALEAAGLPSLTARQRQVVRYFIETLNEPITRADLTRREGCSASVVDALIQKKILSEAIATIERDDAYSKPVANGQSH